MVAGRNPCLWTQGLDAGRFKDGQIGKGARAPSVYSTRSNGTGDGQHGEKESRSPMPFMGEAYLVH